MTYLYLHYTRNIPITSSRTWPKHKQSLFIVYAGDNCARDEIRRCQCDFERIVGIKRGTGADMKQKPFNADWHPPRTLYHILQH